MCWNAHGSLASCSAGTDTLFVCFQTSEGAHTVHVLQRIVDRFEAPNWKFAMSLRCPTLNLLTNPHGRCSTWKAVFTAEPLCEMSVGEWFIVIFVPVSG